MNAYSSLLQQSKENEAANQRAIISDKIAQITKALKEINEGINTFKDL
jgi:hypothetical protein